MYQIRIEPLPCVHKRDDINPASPAEEVRLAVFFRIPVIIAQSRRCAARVWERVLKIGVVGGTPSPPGGEVPATPHSQHSCIGRTCCRKWPAIHLFYFIQGYIQQEDVDPRLTEEAKLAGLGELADQFSHSRFAQAASSGDSRELIERRRLTDVRI
jgi:hypothetical protein